ncbi:MAG: redoxin domain-containing protein [Candidatus Rokubacteria bacterium]|nr:redoxin domain-containing protein [Candidatus Rokubacteria bacterium]
MRGTVYLISAILVAVIAVLLLAGPAVALRVGQKAPEFTLPAPGGKQVKLGDLLGKGPVVIYVFGQAFEAV